MTDSSSVLPDRMRALTQHRYGGPEVLVSIERPLPAVATTEVIVRVRATAVDAGTVHILTGKPYLMRVIGFGFRQPRVPYPGRAFAGEIVALGSAVSGFRVGDRVVGSTSGTFAEYIAVPAAVLVEIPAALTFEAAATLPISGVTALQALRAAGVETMPDAEAPRVLVLGAGGGVGSFAVQLAAADGAIVTGVCSSSKVDFVNTLGAHDVIDYTVDDVTSATRTWDVIIDAGGRRPLKALRRILSPTGHLVLVGAENGGPMLGGLERVLGASLLDRFTAQHLHGLVSRELTADLGQLVHEVASGRLHPAIDRVYPLHEAEAALTRVAQSRALGKVVISI